MPGRKTISRAKRDKREGKSPNTQAGAFVREEIEHVREGKHGARSTKQAIAIGLSKARRAGVDLPPPDEGTASKATRDAAAGDRPHRRPSPKRSRATREALEREGHAAGSHRALSRRAHKSANERTAAERSAAARKAARTKGAAGRSAAAKKAARTRARRAAS